MFKDILKMIARNILSLPGESPLRPLDFLYEPDGNLKEARVSPPLPFHGVERRLPAVAAPDPT